jgi:hypothetical protein
MLVKVTDTVSAGEAAFTIPDMVKAIDFLSLLKTVIDMTADFVDLEVLVTRASAPALPKSLLKVTESNRNDLLCMELEADLDGVGVATPGTVEDFDTQTRLQVNFLPATVTLCPAFVHFEPSVTTP